MASDEQRVRTMAGWIGVEISRSRVRTPGKAGYGLYRVRGSRVIARALPTLGPDMKSRELTGWTGYAFTLEEIDAHVALAIKEGAPDKPTDLTMYDRNSPGLSWIVPTRWTSAYRGRRDLGAGETPQQKVDRLAGEWSAVLGGPAGKAGCGCPNSLTGAPPALHLCLRCGFTGGYESVHEDCAGCQETVRSVQRAANAEFAAEHAVRRAHGLEKRHAAKLKRNGSYLERGATGSDSNAAGRSKASEG